MKKPILILIICIFLGACGSIKHDSIIWQRTVPLGAHYLVMFEDGKFYGIEIGEGYFVVDVNGKIGKVKLFSSEEKKNISNIKEFKSVGVFGIQQNNINEKYVVEIKKGFNLETIVKLDEINHNRRDFLISTDKTLYCAFGSFITNEGITASEWLSIETGEVIDSFKSFSLGSSRVLFENNRYYKVSAGGISVYSNTGEKLFIKLFRKDLFLPNNFFAKGSYKDNLLNDYIKGDDGYFYTFLCNIIDAKSNSYFLVKLDVDLNVIGKRRVNMAETYDDSRCISSIYVDEDSYIYIGSDKEMTITKFKPIEDGEDSLVDLRG